MRAHLFCSWSSMVKNDWTLGNYQPVAFYVTAFLQSMLALAWTMRVVHNEITATFSSWGT